MNNNQSTFRASSLSRLAVGVLAAVAFTAYNFGVQHAATDGVRVIAAPPGTQYVYAYPHPWFGFGFFIPLLLIFLLARGLFWRGAGRCGWHHRAATANENDPDRR